MNRPRRRRFVQSGPTTTGVRVATTNMPHATCHDTSRTLPDPLDQTRARMTRTLTRADLTVPPRRPGVLRIFRALARTFARLRCYWQYGTRACALGCMSMLVFVWVAPSSTLLEKHEHSRSTGGLVGWLANEWSSRAFIIHMNCVCSSRCRHNTHSSAHGTRAAYGAISSSTKAFL